MDGKISAFIDFLNTSHSPYHAAAQVCAMLEEAGFAQLQEQQEWSLEPGGKYYLCHSGSCVIAFRIPEEAAAGFMISASHSDRPAFQVKENLELTGTYTRLATEGYGGMLMSTWLDRPLSIAGRVLVETQTGVRQQLVDIDRDLLLIPNVAIHMNRTANEGMKFNPAVDMLPLMGGEEDAGKLQKLLQQQVDGKILGHDLYLYLRQKASVWGLEEEFISAPALDDLACVWCCTQGFLQVKPGKAINVLCVFDNEEVGSASYQGADSTLLRDVLKRICKASGQDYRQLLSQSLMVSADNAHALHPNHPEFSDAANAPVVNGGVALKFTAQKKYTTDGYTAAIWRSICNKAGVPVQQYYNRADLRGGSTLGNLSQTQVTVPAVDIGLPQLAMHSSFETAGVKDVAYLCDAMTAFYGSAIRKTGCDEYELI